MSTIYDERWRCSTCGARLPGGTRHACSAELDEPERWVVLHRVGCQDAKYVSCGETNALSEAAAIKRFARVDQHQFVAFRPLALQR